MVVRVDGRETREGRGRRKGGRKETASNEESKY